MSDLSQTEASVPIAEKPQKKLPNSVFFAYGFQEFALGFLTTMGVQFFAFFLTDVAFIPAGIAATILLIGRTVDTCDVPFLGMLVERTNLPWGKYRSWLFIAAPLIVLFNLLMFTNFENVPMWFKVVYLSSSYILAYVCVNICSSARLALLPTFTNDNDERAKLSIRRGQGSALTNVIRGAITVPLIALLGFGNPALGYQLTVLLYGIVVIFGLYWIAFLAKPYDKPVPKSERKKNPNQATIKDMFKALGTNFPLLILVLSNTMMLTATSVLQGFNLYYFQYVVGDLNLYSIYMPITYIGMFLGGSITGWLLKKTDSNKKLVYIIGLAIYAVGTFVVLFLPGGAVDFIIFITIAQFGCGISTGLIPAFFSDTADYGEYKTGKSVKAVNMSMVIFPIKLGVLIGGQIAAYGLASIGYVAGTTDIAVIEGIKFLTIVPNALAAVLAIILILVYPLTKKRMTEIQAQLKSRQEEAPEAVTES